MPRSPFNRNRASCMRMLLTLTFLSGTFFMLYYWAKGATVGEWGDIPLEFRRQAGAILSGISNEDNLDIEISTDENIATTDSTTASQFGGPLGFLGDDEDDVAMRVENLEKEVADFEKSLSEWEKDHLDTESDKEGSFNDVINAAAGAAMEFPTFHQEGPAAIGFDPDDDDDDDRGADDLGLLEDTGPIDLPGDTSFAGQDEVRGLVGVDNMDRLQLQENSQIEEIDEEGWGVLSQLEAQGHKQVSIVQEEPQEQSHEELKKTIKEKAPNETKKPKTQEEKKKKKKEEEAKRKEEKEIDTEDYEDVEKPVEEEYETTTFDTTTVETTTEYATTTIEEKEDEGEKKPDKDKENEKAKEKEKEKEKEREKAMKKAEEESKKKEKEQVKRKEAQKQIDDKRRAEKSNILTELNAAPVSRFKQALAEHASKDKTIILLLSDSRYTLLTLNFYETSVIKLGLRNVLFCTMDRGLCTKLAALNIPCVFYDRLEQSIKEALPAHSADITRYKTYYKMRMMFEAVALGYTVFYSDVDTLLLRNPLKDIEGTCQGKCDVALPLLDRERRHVSLSLVYGRPTENAIYFFYDLLEKMIASNMKIPQGWIDKLRGAERLNLQLLGMNKYPHGREYFTARKFVGDEPCDRCVAVINDESFTKEAKTYRFKEMHLWNLNIEGYYSDPERKYIYFDNPYVFTNSTETLIAELKALRNAIALGQLLRRFVILPRFHCFVQSDLDSNIQFCNLHDVLRLEEFHREFMGRYREHTFLTHPKVPESVSTSVSSVYFVGQKLPPDLGPDREIDESLITLVKPRSPENGLDSNEVRNFFEQDNSVVLRFHSLYNTFSHFWSDEVARDFNKKLKRGFAYRKRVKYNLRKLRILKPEPKWTGIGQGAAPDTEKLKQMLGHGKPPGYAEAHA